MATVPALYLTTSPFEGIVAFAFLSPHSISLHWTPPLYKTAPPCKQSEMGSHSISLHWTPPLYKTAPPCKQSEMGSPPPHKQLGREGAARAPAPEREGVTANRGRTDG